MKQKPDETTEVIVPSLNRRFSGVTATVVALLPHQASEISIAGFGWFIPPGTPQLSLLALLRLVRRSHPARPFRIWHARRNIEMLMGLAVKSIARGRLKLVMTSALPRKPSWLSRALLRRMDAIIAVREEVETKIGMKADAVIPHGVDCAAFTPATDRAALWQSLGLGGKEGIAVFGRLRPSKGTDLFVEAMLRILPDFPDHHAVLVGLTRPKDEAFVRALSQKITGAGLKSRITFYGLADGALVKQIYAAASLVVAPSRTEGFGLTPLEAMASGTPVVASTAGAYPLLMHGLGLGGTFENCNIDDLEEMIRRVLLDDRPEAEKVSLCRKHVSEKFDVRIEARKINELYQKLWSNP